VRTGWLLATAAALALMYGPKRYFELDTELVPGRVESMLWAQFRNVWALCVAWVVFACANGHGGPVDRFLSWNAFAPLAKLTYSTYLLSPPVQFMYQASRKTPLWLDYIQFVRLPSKFFLNHFLGFQINLDSQLIMAGNLFGRSY
jgi:peptidoglycan/LPS O-acetylase OafA/YrhL